MDGSLRIALAGFSGSGKTTIAKAISEQYGIPFLSGSYSDLVPETKNIPHSDMIQGSTEEIFSKDVQLLNLRKNLFRDHPKFITDRSFLDSATYFIDKLSHRLQQCDTEDFIEKCRVLNLIYTDKLIFIPFTEDHWTYWGLEDNGKRVMNKFYQEKISELMYSTILNHLGKDTITYRGFIDSTLSNLVYTIEDSIGDTNFSTDVLILREFDHERRIDVISRFIKEPMDLKAFK